MIYVKAVCIRCFVYILKIYLSLYLHTGSLQRVVAHYPQILTMPVKTVKSVVVFLREKCLFTGYQVADILRESPAVVQENRGQLEYKFQVSIETD